MLFLKCTLEGARKRSRFSTGEGVFPQMCTGGSGKDLPWTPTQALFPRCPEMAAEEGLWFLCAALGRLSEVQDGRRLLADNQPVFFKR